MELLAVVTILCTAAFFARLWWPYEGGKRKNLPPGPPGWPLVGNLFQVVFQKQHFVFQMRELRAKYGPIFTIQMGQRTLVIVTSPELIHEALVQKGAAFASRPADSPIRLIFSMGKCALNSAEYGPVWRSLRRNFISELTSPTRIKQCSWIRDWAVENHMKRLQDEVSQIGYINVISNCKLTISSILICICFGVKVSEERIKSIKTILEDVLMLTMPKLPDFLPVFTPLFRPQVKYAKELRKKQLECMIPLVRNRKAFYDSGGKSSTEMASPLGAAYVDSLFDLEVTGREGKLGEEEIVTLCSEAVSAGTDTSAVTLEWALFHLVQDQEVQEKLYKEIVDCVGVNGVVTESDTEKMTYLGAVVKETLRKHPPTHFLLSHAATHETELGGYKIPADVNVEFYTIWMTEDSKMWDNPSAFRPERFLDGDGAGVDITGAKGAKMLPFGAGRRICPAWNVGVLHVNILLAKMVHAYKWIPSPGNILDPTEAFAGTVVMKNSLKAMVLPRTCF